MNSVLAARAAQFEEDMKEKEESLEKEEKDRLLKVTRVLLGNTSVVVW